MAMKRRRSSGRRTRRPFKRARRSYKKRGMKYRRSRGRLPMLSVKRTCYVGNFTPGTAATNQFWTYQQPTLEFAFTDGSGALAGLTNRAEYTVMFDQFKINGIRVHFKPKFVGYNTDQYVPSTGTTFRELQYVSTIIDPKSNVTPSGTYSAATVNSFLEQGNVKTRRADKPFSVYLRNPMVTEQFGGGSTRYIRSPWTDANATNTGQRGYHLFFHNQNMTTTFNSYDVFVTYYLQWKGQK